MGKRNKFVRRAENWFRNKANPQVVEWWREKKRRKKVRWEAAEREVFHQKDCMNK